ncbi:hypothetical protein SMSRO_SF009620 [Spiroplasma poulsonii]|uniref:Uncharacterized protein n=1 Tax=Spiroplasma poulsonii TaxID=2138 RepID=A0A2P6FCG8_9MOLU|nr:hypothetical protein SMSRO_SF009620 [Spiroplasma poulsonii]PWF98935.1 hypothetical protein SMH99_14980 [Spiroplasma poulsonii]
MLNTIIGMMGTIAVIGLFGCLWKFLGIKFKKWKNKFNQLNTKKFAE